MKAAGAAFQAMLESGLPLVGADLYTLTLKTGDVYRWTSAQRPLTVGGVRYAVGPAITRDKLAWKIGLGVDQINISLQDAGVTRIGELTLAAAARRGLFDGATLELRRWLSPAWEQVGEPATVTVDLAAGTFDKTEINAAGQLQLIRPAPRATAAGDTRVTDAGDIRYTA